MKFGMVKIFEEMSFDTASSISSVKNGEKIKIKNMQTKQNNKTMKRKKMNDFEYC